MTRWRVQGWAPWCALALVACDADMYRSYPHAAAPTPIAAQPLGHAAAPPGLAGSDAVVASAMAEPSADARASAARPEQLYLQAAALLAHDRASDAVGLLERCIVLDNAFSKCYRALGLAYSERGAADIAVAYYEKYLALAPGAVDAPVVRHMIQAVLQEPHGGQATE